MYGSDSFFSLSAFGQAGLILLSLVLSAGLILVVRILTGRLPVFWRITIAFVVFWLFVWLSPQVYYSYYQLIIEGLPMQNVIKAPLGARRIIDLMLFWDQATISNHGKAVLGWAIVAAAAFKLPRRSELTSV